jgi:hypothetical protein
MGIKRTPRYTHACQYSNDPAGRKRNKARTMNPAENQVTIFDINLGGASGIIGEFFFGELNPRIS